MKKFLLVPVFCALFASCGKETPVAQSNDMNMNEMEMNKMDMQSNSMMTSDSEITAKVKQNLMSDDSLSKNAKMISVSTNHGVVTLTGKVASYQESRYVERMVHDVSGVVKVDNQLTISSY